MGGRGASFGIYYLGGKWHVYGDEYRSIVEYGNIKFIQKIEGSANLPLETMTKGRVYVLINDKNEVKAIGYYDNDGKKVKQIDVQGPKHKINGKKELPHTHIGYDTHKGDSSDTRIPNARESKMIDRAKKLWDYYNSKR